MKTRPLGVTILAVLAFLNMAVYIVFAVLSIVSMDRLAAILQALSPGGAGPAAMQMSMQRFLPVYYVVFMLITGALGLGFWKLWNWARIVSLLLIGVSLIAAVWETFSDVHGGNVAGGAVYWVRIGVSVLISVLIGWYLMSAKVRAAFGARATGPGSESGS
jgi:hypothetical protein